MKRKFEISINLSTQVAIENIWSLESDGTTVEVVMKDNELQNFYNKPEGFEKQSGRTDCHSHWMPLLIKPIGFCNSKGWMVIRPSVWSCTVKFWLVLITAKLLSIVTKPMPSERSKSEKEARTVWLLTIEKDNTI